MRCSIAFLLIALGIAMVPSLALAGGLEYTAAGAQALGRGGAVAARADDPMVLAYNPAGLAELRGTQLLFNFNVAMMDACIDPIGYYGWNTYGTAETTEFTDPDTGETVLLDLGNSDPNVPQDPYYSDPMDTVCLDQAMLLVPQLVVTSRLHERVGIGLGLIFPAAQPVGRWGGENGLIRNDEGELRPSPVRYAQLQLGMIGVFPTVGVGVRIIDELRLGAALQWGMVSFDSSAMTSSASGTAPQQDIVYKLHGDDMFVPSLTVSAHAVPIDEIDVVVAFKWQDAVSGNAELTTVTGIFNPNMVPHVNDGLKVNEVRQGMPWKLAGGIRYANRYAPRPEGTGTDEADEVWGGTIHDPLSDERWDIELDVEYQFNSKNDVQHIEYEPGQAIYFEDLDGNLSKAVEFPPPNKPYQDIPKKWKDQASIRLGGTYNVVREILGISAGAHYENRGVDPAYKQPDFWPLERLGLHAGFTVRVLKTWDFVFSYAHIFQETLTVATPPHCMNEAECEVRYDMTAGKPKGTRGTMVEPPLLEDSVEDADATAKLEQIVTMDTGGKPIPVVNSGTYRSSFDVVAVGFNVHF